MSQFNRFSDALKGATAHMDALKGATAHMDALKGATAHMDIAKALSAPTAVVTALSAQIGAAKTAMASFENLNLAVPKIPHQDFLKQAEEYSKTSDKIRALAAASMPRADIARHLGVRYQHVRNVLVRDEEKAAEHTSSTGGDQAAASPATAASGLLRGKMGPAGRVVIPAPVREKLGLDEGAELVFTLDGDEVRVASMATHLKRLQAKVRSYLPDEAGLVDELISERKREAGAE